MAEAVMPAVGTFCWNELITKDAGAAKKFYAALFGWQMSDQQMGPMTYTLLKQNGKDAGGLMQMTPEMGPGPSHWVAYVSVENTDATAKKAEALGAKILCPPMDIPNIGRFAVIQDPTGATLAFIKLGG